MEIERILEELKAERDRLTRAIQALEGGPAHRTANRGPKPERKRRKRTMSPEGRRRLSELMKKRWATRRRKAA